MPYPNEHAARLHPPGRYTRMRRKNNQLGPGIDAIFGFREGGGGEIQAIRFDASRFTPAKAKAWLKDHDFSPSSFEPSAPSKKRKPDGDGDEDFELKFEITKRNDEQQIAWGWAYVTKTADEPRQQVYDASTEFTSPEEMQKAAHGFVHASRIGDVMHDNGFHGEVVDSIFFTEDIQDVLKIRTPVGWFIGYKIRDPELWADVKKRKYCAFSIGGSCLKEVVDV